jgi:hypothetical protein
MEDCIWQRTSQLAAVVRNFSPSRLEHQLLAQAFELAWNRSQVVEATKSDGSASANGRLDCLSTASQAMTSRAAWR